ncbi:MAG: hypothetical protein VX278_06480 [Myxococcota bacterium]|nr:hypothetical protein [Myxococcota bacterium]
MSSDLPSDAFESAILLDAIPVGIKLEAWRAANDSSHPSYLKSTIRLGFLVRIIDPKRALLLADEAEALLAPIDELHPLRALAYLEINQPQKAWSHISPMLPGDLKDLLTARFLLLQGSQEEAIVLLNSLLERDELHPEWRADALSFRARTHGKDKKKKCIVDLRAIEELALQEEATITGVWVGCLCSLLQSEQWETVAKLLSTFDMAGLLKELCEAIDTQTPDLGLIPSHVHGAFVLHKKDPEQAAEKLIQVAALQWRLGMKAESHQTIVYASRISKRLFGGVCAHEIHMFELVLRRHAGEEEWSKLANELQKKETDFLHQLRKDGNNT